MERVRVNKKCCSNCKYIRETFGFNAKESVKLWECTALLGIDPYYTSHPVSKNFVCDWHNKSYESIRKEFEEAMNRPKFQYTRCLGKIDIDKIKKYENI